MLICIWITHKLVQVAEKVDHILRIHDYGLAADQVKEAYGTGDLHETKQKGRDAVVRLIKY